ncbi:hypothetical protein E2542_SST16679 [Spatholobus suberectus]|nr:hypothetical protein E2542_SST16679 [Spatholobus suberectus]
MKNLPFLPPSLNLLPNLSNLFPYLSKPPQLNKLIVSSRRKIALRVKGERVRVFDGLVAAAGFAGGFKRGGHWMLVARWLFCSQKRGHKFTTISPNMAAR